MKAELIKTKSNSLGAGDYEVRVDGKVIGEIRASGRSDELRYMAIFSVPTTINYFYGHGMTPEAAYEDLLVMAKEKNAVMQAHFELLSGVEVGFGVPAQL